MVVKPPFPPCCPSSTLRLLVLPRARASLSAGFLHLLSILYPVLACQPFILYQDESVRVGPNIKGDGSPLARDRDTEIRRSDTEVRDFLIGGPGRVSSGRSLRGKRRFREIRNLAIFSLRFVMRGLLWIVARLLRIHRPEICRMGVFNEGL